VYRGVSRLTALGHRRIGFCTVTAYPIAAGLRRAGYERALAEAGISPDPSLVVEAPAADTRAGLAAARAMLAGAGRPTAVFCFSDQIAFGFYQVAAELRLRVPQDLSVLGFDDQKFIAEALSPGLTTIKLPHRAMGEWAAERVLNRLAAEAPTAAPEARGYRFPCPVVERGSIAPPGAA
jgi:LacI family transcriptional regulator